MVIEISSKETPIKNVVEYGGVKCLVIFIDYPFTTDIVLRPLNMRDDIGMGAGCAITFTRQKYKK